MRETRWKSWLGFRDTKRKGASESMTDLTILFCSDAHEWDNYLTQCLLQVCEPKTLNIRHETLDSVSFPLSAQRTQQFLASKATLVIISPDFLDFVEGRAEVFEVGKLLDPSTTVAMLCGVRESDVSHLHKAALVSYDAWPRLQARDQDKDFVLDVIKRTQDILTRTEESRAMNKPKFKLTPRKVKLGHNKVYILLNEAVTSSERLQVFLEGEDFREVPAKSRNPFTLQFLVPDSYLHSSRMLNIHVRLSDGGPSLGLQPIKVESQMGEMFSLLSSVNSPYELICQTYGVSTHAEVDKLLAEGFALKMPFGISLLENMNQADKKRSEEELPSLVHFAARYGLEELINRLLLCPGAAQACLLRNSRGLTPGQMASHAGHHRLTSLLEEFQRCPSPKSETSLCREPVSTRATPSTNQGNSYVNVLNGKEGMESEEPYDVPSRIPLPVQQGNNVNDLLDEVVPIPTRVTDCGRVPDQREETGYIDMRILRVFGKEKLLPHEALLLELNTRPQCVNNEYVRSEPREEILDIIVSDGSSPVLNDNDGQQELVQLIERYKKGASMAEVETDFKIWQNKHNNSDLQGSLVKLKGSKKPTKKQSFNFPDFKYFVLSKFNKKDSSTCNLTESPKVSKKSIPLDELDDSRPVSTISSSSSASRASTLSSDRFSTLSFGSAYDSGHQSDSCDEGNRVKGISRDLTSPANQKLFSPAYTPNQISTQYTSPNLKPFSTTCNLQQTHRSLTRQKDSETISSIPPPYQKATSTSKSPSPKPKLANKVSISSRPPAPPPRPTRLKGLQFKAVVTNKNDCDRIYYNQHDLPVCPGSPDYVAADNEDYLLVNRDKFKTEDKRSVVGSVCKWKSSGGDYYKVPALPSAIRNRSLQNPNDLCNIEDYSIPSSLPVVTAKHSDYYDVPRPGCLPVELDNDERCDSIPDELAPPPPTENN